jgi:glycosyltransferase involved in cell wall biosynthesis
LSVVIPCFNEEATIAQILKRVLSQPSVLEVILIDDCSTDATPNIMNNLKNPRVKYIRNSKNLGKGKGA